VTFISATSARCASSSVACSSTNRRIRLTRTPSLTHAGVSGGVPRAAERGTLAWCSATISHWSLKTGEPDEPRSVSAR